jgi:hypothetical protein
VRVVEELLPMRLLLGALDPRAYQSMLPLKVWLSVE